MKRTDRIAAMLALVAALAAPAHVGAQDIEEAGGSLLSAAIGTGAGLVGGGYANLAVVVLKAPSESAQRNSSAWAGREALGRWPGLRSKSIWDTRPQ